jgi:hypothetical protein
VAISSRAADNGGDPSRARSQALVNLAMVFRWELSDKQTSALILLVMMGSAVFI